MTFIKSILRARQHDTTHSPEGLWQLDGDLTDSSGNGYTLTVEAGTERYAPLPGGLIKGFLFDGASNLIYNVAEAGVRLIGDMTAECLIAWNASPGISPSDNRIVIVHEGSGETEAENVIYRLGSGTSVAGFRYFAESGAGVNIDYSCVDGAPPGLQHLAMVRSSADVTFYVNGQALAATSSGLNAPTGGASGRLRIGSGLALAQPLVATVSSMKLIASALTAQQIADEYGRTLG